MGQAVIGLAAEQADLQVIAAMVRKDSLESIRSINAWDSIPCVSELPDNCVPDVLIDFSGASGFDSALALAEQRGIAFVSGSTGLSIKQHEALEAASLKIPLVWAANFSLGVAVLAHLAERAARLLPDWDCEIFEAHHRNKQDAPSGTALMLGQRVNAARETTQSPLPADRNGPRPPGSVGYAVMRGGDIIGEHELRLVGAGERLELVHRATDRRLFARGALHAARWLRGKKPGHYDLNDVLGINAREFSPGALRD